MQLKKWVIKNKYKLIAGSAFFASLVTIPSIFCKSCNNPICSWYNSGKSKN